MPELNKRKPQTLISGSLRFHVSRKPFLRTTTVPEHELSAVNLICQISCDLTQIQLITK